MKHSNSNIYSVAVSLFNILQSSQISLNKMKEEKLKVNSDIHCCALKVSNDDDKPTNFLQNQVLTWLKLEMDIIHYEILK